MRSTSLLLMTMSGASMVSHSCLPFRITWGAMTNTEAPESWIQLSWGGAQVVIFLKIPQVF